MEKGWVKIYSSTSAHLVEIARALLDDHGIRTVLLNKQDSMHRHLNESCPQELFVSRDNALRARHLISKNLA